MEVTPLSLSDFFEKIIEHAQYKNYKWVFMFIGREAEAGKIYSDIDKFWASLNDLTHDRIAFIISTKFQSKNNSFYHSPGKEGYVGKMCPFARIVGGDCFKDNDGDFEYCYDKFSRCNWKEEHTQSVTQFIRKYGITESELPGLFIYNIFSKDTCFVKMAEQDDIYKLVKYFVQKTEEIDKMLEDAYQKIESNNVKSIVELEETINEYAEKQEDKTKKLIKEYLSDSRDYQSIKPLISDRKMRGDLKRIGQWKRQARLRGADYEDRKKEYYADCEKYTSVINEIKGLLCEIEKEYTGDRMGKEEKEIVDIGIITALDIECAAVLRVLGETKKVCDNERQRGNVYYIGEVLGIDGKVHYVAVMMSGENNNKSSIACTEFLSFFPNMKTIIMCGIGAGIPNEHNPEEGVHLGDVVVSTSVDQVDYGKALETGFESKSITMKAAANLLKAVKRIKVNEMSGGEDCFNGILEGMADDRYKRPSEGKDPLLGSGKEAKVFEGAIASSNLVVRDKEVRDCWQKEYKAIAIEMEGSGIADASWDNSAGFIIVRGICDYADKNKNDEWHSYAALCAAVYTLLLIKELPS